MFPDYRTELDIEWHKSYLEVKWLACLGQKQPNSAIEIQLFVALIVLSS